MNAKSLLWFFVGFVFVSFASSLWLLLSSVLTVMPVPLPYWLLYTPGNIVAAGVVVAVLMLVLYTYLGVVLVLGKLHRGFVPITMVIAFTIGSALLLAKLAIPALAVLAVAYVLLVGTYIVIISTATSRASKALWGVATIILTLIPPILVGGGPAVIDYVKYMAITEQATAIIASAIEAWKLGVEGG
jgi:ABC-type multidrug transport system permease subunit